MKQSRKRVGRQRQYHGHKVHAQPDHLDILQRPPFTLNLQQFIVPVIGDQVVQQHTDSLLTIWSFVVLQILSHRVADKGHDVIKFANTAS